MTTDELKRAKSEIIGTNFGESQCHESTMRTAVEAIDECIKQEWIPCSERLPECEKEVYIITERGTCTTAIHEDGTMSTEDSAWNWNDMDFSYDEENDTYIIPELWCEYRHFNPDEVYNNIVDEKVIAWMPLPEPYREENKT